MPANALFERPEFNSDCILVHVSVGGAHSEHQEFEELVRSTGANARGSVVAKVNAPHPRYLVGGGKAEEIAELVQQTGAGLAIFDHALSPSQERNLEATLKCRVLDRAGLILDIFAQRARSFEGKLQVELAQLAHLSTRLVRGWTHLERQKGGIGLRGPGETQLETDRRLIAVRIKQITRRLERVTSRRELGRSHRKKQELPTVSLVGYTNAGKSTLFNRLTNAHAYSADQLFATLDPTIRKFPLGAGNNAVLADTVGFINNLPHELVEAFRSTLQETREASLLLHVIDAADPMRSERIEQVQAVLNDIGADEIPQIHVYNKIDKLDAETRADLMGGTEPGRAVAVSAQTGEGLEPLTDAVSALLLPARKTGWLTLPANLARERAMLYQYEAVEHEQIGSSGEYILRLSISEKDWNRFLKSAELNGGLAMHRLERNIPGAPSH